MDKTPEYIKMCGKAAKLQEGWIPRYGDLFQGWANHDIEKDGEYPELLIVGECLWGEPVEPKRSASFCIWLPRQDQLQGMISNDVSDIIQRGYDYVECVYPDLGGMDFNPTSMEKLWLAFVMYEKHGMKEWNGEDWVNES